MKGVSNYITEASRLALIQGIYDTLMSSPDVGLGEMGEAREEATRIVDDWAEKNNVVIQTPEDMPADLESTRTNIEPSAEKSIQSHSKTPAKP